MSTLVAIDPGDKYTGFVELPDDELDLFSADTFNPEQTVARLELLLPIQEPRLVSRVVVERFQLYPNRVRFKAWSGLEVIELIGVIKYLCKKANVPCLMVAPPDVNAFWRNREIDPTIKKKLGTKHEVSAYRLGEYARVLRPIA
jgi:hypothetical protein